jgi:thymidylate synthase (FAD)
MKDIIQEKYGEKDPLIACLDHGFVQLLDCMPRIIKDSEKTADYAIAEAARCSYQRGTKTIADDKALIRYLMRHNHTSPFEMIEFKFKMKLPIFVARQIIRHRTANLNELSGRYSEMPEEYYIPEELRLQSQTNTQGSEGTISDGQGQMMRGLMRLQGKDAFNYYKQLLGSGVAREQARAVLPLSTYTEWYWKIDLKNLLHFLDLRCDGHAQEEVRVYADAILELIKPIVPWTIEAWEDYSSYRGGMILTKYEVEALKEMFNDPDIVYSDDSGDIKVDNKLEQKEWKDKSKKLGF